LIFHFIQSPRVTPMAIVIEPFQGFDISLHSKSTGYTHGYYC
jgi:hypothetical protein